MPPAAFTIKLGEGDKRVSVETLTQALENALEILRNVGQALAPTSVAVRWEVVAASLRSPLSLSFAPRAQGKAYRAVGKRIANACVRGIGQLEQKASLPPHFNEEALLATEKLFKVAQKDGAKLTVATDRKREVTPTSQAVEHIRQVVEKARVYIDFGTIEGTLEIVSVHERASFFVFETLTGNKVECIGTPEQFAESLTLLKKRVAVTGRIRYRNHRPTSVNVESVRVLRSSADPPQSRKMGPIDITGGKSSEDHVRELRDAR